MESKSKRKKLFVDPVVQGTLAKRLILHWGVFFAIVVGLQFMMIWMVDPLLSFGELTNKVIQNSSLFLIAIVLLFPSFIYDTIKLSNRFAGPMIRLKTELESVANSGELKPIKFREGDFWQEMAASYNRMVEKIGETTHQDQARSSEPRVASSSDSTTEFKGNRPDTKNEIAVG